MIKKALKSFNISSKKTDGIHSATHHFPGDADFILSGLRPVAHPAYTASSLSLLLGADIITSLLCAWLLASHFHQSFLPLFAIYGFCYTLISYCAHKYDLRKNRYILGKYFIIELLVNSILVFYFYSQHLLEQVLPLLIGFSLIKIAVLSTAQHALFFKYSLQDVNCLSYHMERTLKRTADILISMVGFALLLPLLGLTALCVYWESPGNVLYYQKRIGYNEKEFTLLKFRSMRQDAERIRQELAPPSAALFKLQDDPRLTKVGRIIRKCSIDELPQLWNVLKGEMTLVGPRPPIIPEYKEMNRFHRMKFNAVSGLTGLWQITGRIKNERDFDSVAKYDIEYIQNWSLLNDVLILFKTLPVVLLQKGAW